MRKIMEALLKDEYKNDYAFSYLYPFSHAFIINLDTIKDMKE